MADNNSGTFSANVSAEDLKKLQDANAKQAQEMAELKATLERIQKSNAATAVPPSVSQPSMSVSAPIPQQDQAVPNELAELALDWGDFDPEFKHKVFTDAAFRAEFIKFHSTDHTEVRVIHESQILTAEDYHRKRTRTELNSPGDLQTITDDEALSKVFLQYHQSEVLPQLEALRTA